MDKFTSHLRNRIGNNKMKKNNHRLRFYVWALFFSLTLITTLFVLIRYQSEQEKQETMRFVKQLGPGFNLGNTLDTHDLNFETNHPYDFETYWDNPITTREMIQDIKAAGFNVLRIPVTWYEHMDEHDQIDEAWLSRVQQVVDYGLQSGMYVIINAHHDSWYTPDDTHLPSARKRMTNLWKQIAKHFKEYDQHLLFESMNEPRLIDKEEEWNEGTLRSREIINELNKVFVETVRVGDGFNKDRYLILPTYCARTDEVVLEEFQLPNDHKLILSVHLYAPYHFTLDMEGTAIFDLENPMDTNEIDQVFKNLSDFSMSRKVPIIITEFSAMDKNNEEARTTWARYIRGKAEELGISYIWWDDGGGKDEAKPSPLYNRYTREWLFPNLQKALIE